MNRKLFSKCLAELVGTFMLVFCGTGAIVINEVSGGAVTHAGIAITFGLIVLGMIYSIGEISGAHINPAVTIAFRIAKRFPGREVTPYIISQLAGAFLASLTLKILFPIFLSVRLIPQEAICSHSFSKLFFHPFLCS